MRVEVIPEGEDEGAKMRVARGVRARDLVQSLDPDRITADALDAAKAAGITRSAETLTDAELAAAKQKRIATACMPFDAPALRDAIEGARREREQIIDTLNENNAVLCQEIQDNMFVFDNLIDVDDRGIESLKVIPLAGSEGARP